MGLPWYRNSITQKAESAKSKVLMIIKRSTVNTKKGANTRNEDLVLVFSFIELVYCMLSEVVEEKIDSIPSLGRPIESGLFRFRNTIMGGIK